MNFDIAFERVIGHEGGYVDDPNDPGGETKFGVSKRSYPDVDIASLTVEDAKAIYRRDYWERAGCHKLPGRVAFQVFDCAINSGVETALRLLKQSASATEADTVLRFNAERLAYMTSLRVWPSFSKGWARRIATNLRYGAEDQ